MPSVQRAVTRERRRFFSELGERFGERLGEIENWESPRTLTHPRGENTPAGPTGGRDEAYRQSGAGVTTRHVGSQQQ